MTTSERNSKIRYQGSAVLWQGPNRITAETIEIDRANSRLDARGNVATQLLDRRSEKPEAKETGKAPAKPKSAPLFTTVRAPELTYTDKDRLAYYRNGVTLQRPGLTVTSRELRAWMTPDEPGKESTLDKAFADGSAKIVQQAPDRTRTFTGEHAEYYLADEHMVITGGHPQLVDSLKGNTRGQKLTWFARNDRLLVESGESEPGVTDIRKK